MAARPRFERGTPGSAPGVIPVSPPRIDRNAGGGEWPAFRFGTRSFGTDGRIRTDTRGGLSAVPLPVGLRQRVRGRCRVGGPRSARISSCRVSTSRSTVRASGPGACSRTGRTKAIALFTFQVKEPSSIASSRWCDRRESNPHLQRCVLRSSPLNDDHVVRSVNRVERGDAGSCPSGLQRELPFPRGVATEGSPLRRIGSTLDARAGFSPA